MKKIIAASILSLSLFGVGSANSDGMRIGVGTAYANGDAHTWQVEVKEFAPTPIEDCMEATKKGVLVYDDKIDKLYIYDDRVYWLIFRMLGAGSNKIDEPVTIRCLSASPTSVIK